MMYGAGQDPVLREQIGAYFPSILLTLRWNQIAYGWVYRETAVWDLGLKVLFYAPLVLFATAAVAWGRTAAVRGWRGTAGAEDERRLLVLAWAGGWA